jgi:pyruvate kinase
MDEIVTRAETYISKYRHRTFKFEAATKSMVSLAGHAVATLSEQLRQSNMDAKILCNTKTGHTAHMISKYRPNVPIVAMTPNLKVARQLCLVWGVRALYSESLKGDSEEEQVLLAVNKAWEKGYMKDTDKVITVSPSNVVPQLGTIVGIYSVGDILPRAAPEPVDE